MTGFARWLIRVSSVLFALTGALILLAMAIKGYWGLFFPFLVVFALWAWWVRTHPTDFR